MSQEDIIKYFKGVVKNQAVWPMVSALYDKTVTADNLKVTYARSIMTLAAPLNVNGIKYTDQSDRYEDQMKYAADFLVAYQKKIEKDKKDGDSLSVNLVGQLPLMEKFQELINNDGGFAMFSVIFVFITFCIHLKSFFLAFIGIMIILFSFPLTVMITEGILRCTFFSSLHTLAIFIVLGIAADDVFVFIDAWR